MQCPSCSFENPEGAKFCEECGAPFGRMCPGCGQQVRPTAKFCPECGAALTAGSKPAPVKSRSRKGAKAPGQAPRPKTQPPQPPLQGAAPEAERRQLTVMFCDLVGSTALSTQLDPEELREVVQQYQQTCAAIIQRHDGTIAQYLGDGLLVYFGYPSAHEDDARRAVRAGLEIIETLRDASAPSETALQVRIGIHTGPVVVGEMGGGDKREQLALGDTPNIAARLQGLAEPDTVVISAATQRLVVGLFACHNLGPRTLKGLSAPLSVYRVVGEEAAQSRFEVALQTGLIPLVGREEELGMLRRRWEQAKGGAGQVVLLSGEPGIGKSRLVQELRAQLGDEGVARIEFRCSSYHQNSATYPLIAHLQRFLQFAREDSPAVKLEKLRHMLSHYRFPQADTLSLLAALLSLPHPEGSPPLTTSPQKQKEQTQAALVAWLAEEAEQHPVYCVWEDLHWADPSTLELLTLLLDQVPTTRLMTVLTFRPEFTPPWGNRSHLSQLTVSRLGRTQVEAMMENVTGGKTLPPEVLQQIVAKTDGVPLFVEELTKSVAEAVGTHGGATLQLLDIPATLQDSLMARLDRLHTAKELAQLGATLGREFSYELLHALSPVTEDAFQHGLRQLVESELVYQRGLPPKAQYTFKHALIQDAAYQSLLKSRRQQLHQQIARILEERFPDTKAIQPELLAHHYSRSGNIEKAVTYLQLAGQQAVQRSANVEAVNHLTTGIALLQTLPQTAERNEQELALHVTLGTPLGVIKGYTAPEVEHVYLRARDLCQQLGDTQRLAPVLFGLWAFHFMRAEYPTAEELGEQLLALAHRVQDTALRGEAHYALGEILLRVGNLNAARTQWDQSVQCYDRQQHEYLVSLYVGYDPAVASLSLWSWTLWVLGYPDQSLVKRDEALALAEELSHPFSLTFALTVAAWLHQYRREAQPAQRQAERVMSFAVEQGVPYWVAEGNLVRGWALVEQGQAEQGIEQLRQGATDYRTLGADLGQPYFLGLLADAYGKTGQVEEGFRILAEAFAFSERIAERWCAAELHRLKGELLLQAEGQSRETRSKEAEACFQQALHIARQQDAKSWELRAATSLARLWQSQGKTAEARQMLAEIYGWFTEGFDTKDLQEAKALLEELA